jgi:hypothetical protein
MSSTLSQSTIGNANSVPGSQNTSNVQPDGSTVVYSDAGCDLIASVQDLAGGNILGGTIAVVTVEPSVLTYPAIGGQPYTRRWISITPANNLGVNAIVTMYQTQADFDDYNLSAGLYPLLPTGPSDVSGIANIRITKVSGGILGVGTSSVITPTSVNWNATNNYWEITFTVTGTFSSFFVHAANPLGSALPVTVLSFSGTKENDQDVIRWTSGSEQNNAFYNIQHSQDGIRFTTLSHVPTKATNGNSSTLLSYETSNTQPDMGHNYYRLEQVDINGTSNLYNKIIDLFRSENGTTATIYPNPAQDKLNIDLYTAKQSDVEIKIMNMYGAVVKQILATTQEGTNTLKIDLKELAKGVYTIVLQENGQRTLVEKITKD